MNLSINVVKTAILGIVLFAAFLMAFVAEAAVSITSATLDDTSVAPGTTVTVNISANKTGSGCDNNWNYTRVTVDGNVYESDSFWGDLNPTNTSGSGKNADTVSFPAPATPGSYSVLVEIVGGGEVFGETNCDNGSAGIPNWDTETLSLDVVIDQFIRMTNLTPVNETRELGDTNTVDYVATVEVGGDPVSGQLQCVVFDIFRGDGWQTVSVTDANTPGIYNIPLSYSIASTTEYPVGSYDVIAFASSESCTDTTDGDFTTDTYRDSNGDFHRSTVLNIIEPIVLCEDENANNYGKEAPCTYNEVTLYQIFGYVWNDIDEDGSEITEPEDGENGLGGIIVTITNGEDEFTTETEEDGYYEFFVPAGTWTISDGDINDFEQTYPINDGNVHVVTVPGDLVIPVEDDSLLTAFLNWLIPTAHAQSAPGFGPYNFGNTEVNDDRSSSRSTATRVGDRDRSSSSDRDNDSSSDTPEGQVLGEATSVMPVGAPNTGHGGTAPVNTQLPALLAILGTNRIGKKTN